MNEEIPVDGTDLEIIDMLVRDGRGTLAEIGAAVSLSAPAVKRRISRLEETGVITGFTAVLDHEKLGRSIEAFTELRFAGKTKVADIAGIARDLPEVEAVYTTAGDPD
ncbi:MAG: Lrp/AsnC family transcriptional regulator, partial [Solirubrobacterales bacterium]|nr:Lrp/AsnC family transcriptional regulator [Solirubrobacterales bacterium]